MTDAVLACRSCGRERAPGSLDYRCGYCGGELVVRYRAAARWQGHGLWRYASRLPVVGSAPVVSLGEGATPIVPIEHPGLPPVAVKCEQLNPTGSFKDRIAAVAVTIARERGLPGCVGTSSGNGGAAAAAYCARAGLRAVLFALSDTAEQKLAQIRALGATVYLVDGLGHDAADTERAATTIARLAAERGMLPLLTGGRFSPEAMEGAATIAYELAEEYPQATHVYVPVGGGGLLSAVARGYRAGPDGVRPRIVGVQPAGCPTLRHALAGQPGGLTGPCTTAVSGLQVPILFDAPGAVEAITESGGHLVEVDDERISAAQRILAREHGILVEPAGAAAFAGAIADAEAGRLPGDARVAVIATGAGYKDSAALARLAAAEPVRRIGVAQIEEMMADA